MVSRLNPYINFDGNARQAMEFYREVFGGELSMNTFGEFSDPNAAGGPDPDGVMHAQLETDGGFTLMAADLPTDEPLESGNRFTISLSGDDVDELRGYWERLSEGGQVGTALDKQMWGDHYGDLTDRFGIRWLVNIAGEQVEQQG